MRPPSLDAVRGSDGGGRRCPEARADVADLQRLHQFICKCESSRGLLALFARRSFSVPGLDLLREFPENSNGRYPCNWYSPSRCWRTGQRVPPGFLPPLSIFLSLCPLFNCDRKIWRKVKEGKNTGKRGIRRGKEWDCRSMYGVCMYC